MGAYSITSDHNDIIIRLPKAETDQNALEKLLDYLEFESIRRRSQLTRDQVDNLTSEIKQGAWHQVKHLFEE